MRCALWPLILVALLIALTACGASQAATGSPSANNAAATTAAPAGQTTELNIFAAASLTDAFKEIGMKFEAANPGAKLIFNFAGSQQLAQQIGQGAPADVFASANKKQMDMVIQSGQVISGTQRTFVRNRLVVIYPKDNPAKLNTLKDLAKPGVKLVLAAKDVPVGGYALDFLARASKLPNYTEAYSPTVLANVRSYEENVKAVLSKVALGEADAGIVYTSDIALDSADKVGRLDIPDDLNTIAAYPIAPIKGSQHADLAKKFVEYVLSPAAQQILVKYGFIAV
jgi:molybdate transport system substrate-binding protein